MVTIKPIKYALRRWEYRFLSWFCDKPDALARRVKVENQLFGYAAKGTSPTPEECRSMALYLGTPTNFNQKRKQ